MAFDKRVTNSDGAVFGRAVGASAFATSAGFSGSVRGTHVSLAVEPLCDDTSDPKNPKKRNGYWWTASRYLGKLDPADAVGIEAARRTVATLGSRKVETQECPIVFDPEIALHVDPDVDPVAETESLDGNIMVEKGQFLRERYFALFLAVERLSKQRSKSPDHLPRDRGVCLHLR